MSKNNNKTRKRFLINISLMLVFIMSATFFMVACGDTGDTSTPSYYDGEYGGERDYNIEETGKYLIKNGTTEYKLVQSKKATEREKLAVNELKYFFYIATGIDLEVIEDEGLDYSANSKYISVGDTSLLRQAQITVDKDRLDRSGFIIYTKGLSVFLSGAQDYGTLYSSYEFLSQIFDYEYYAPTAIKIDKDVTDVKLMKYDITDVPDIHFTIANSGNINADKQIASRYRMVRMNDVLSGPNNKNNHNSFLWLPKETYQEDHPDWYSPDGSQLSYSARGNQEEYLLMVEEAFLRMKEFLISQPNAMMVSFGHEDTRTWCTSGDAVAKLEKYGTNAATLIHFLNDLKEKVDIWFESDDGAGYKRDLVIYFLAYHQADKPPAMLSEKGEYVPVDDSVKLRDGVVPYFASFNLYPKSEFVDRLKGWKALSDKVMVWTYETNFTHYLSPYDSFNDIDTFRFVASMKPYLIFPQGQHNQTGSVAGFGELKTYLNSKLSWDASLDMEILIADFFENYYGIAAQPMMDLFNSFRVQFTHSRTELGYSGDRAVLADVLLPSYWPKNILRSWSAKIDEALSAISILQYTDKDSYGLLSRNIYVERVFINYLLLEIYGETELSASEIEVIKGQLRNDIAVAGFTKLSSSAPLTDFTKKWSI